MTKKSYNVVLNSNSLTGSTGTLSYYFDNNLIPNGQYKLTFSFAGMVATLTTGLYLNIFTTVGQDSVYEAGVTSSANSTFLGMVCQTYNTTISSIHNVPVFLETGPKLNTITVGISAPDGTIYTALTHYNLVLHFEPV